MDTRRRSRRARKTGYPDFTQPSFTAEQMQAFASDPELAEFCQSAFYVDGHEAFTVLGTAFLALRAHIPPELAQLEPVRCEEDLERITQNFRVLRWGETTLWRCDVWCIDPARPMFSLVGTLDRQLLEELREARSLTIIDVPNWGRPDPAMVELTIYNDSRFWEAVDI